VSSRKPYDSTIEVSNLSPIKLILDLTRHGQMTSPGYSENANFKSMKMKTFEWITSKIHSKLEGYSHWVHLWCTQQQYKKLSHATNPQAGPGTFESIISKLAQRLGACEGQIFTGSTRRRKPCLGPRASHPTRSSRRGPGQDYS
jgi:hypothetical protein